MNTLFQRFEMNAARHPDKAAFIYSQNGDWTTVTYAQLLDSTQRFSSGLSACSLTPGMSAALMTPPSVRLLRPGIRPAQARHHTHHR